MMIRPRTVIPRLLLAFLAFAGCATSQGAAPMIDEDLLAAAGFRSQPADTPARQSALATMPPVKMIRRTKDGKVFYTLADPYNCKCLYVGNQENYDQYKRLGREQRTSREAPDAIVAPADEMGWNPETGLWGSVLPPEIGGNFR